jgi:hypothetical protein
MNTPTENTLEPANGTRSSGAAAAIVAAVVIILGVIAWILLGPARDTWSAATQPAPNATSTVSTSTPPSTDGTVVPASTVPETPASALPFGADQVLALGVPAQLFEGDVTIFATSTAAQGTLVVMKGFTDSRCPADVQCIWAGERGVTFEVTNLRTGQKSEISLKERTNPKVVLFGRTFVLTDVEDGKGGDYAEIQVD